jgi:hypothetical protein
MARINRIRSQALPGTEADAPTPSTISTASEIATGPRRELRTELPLPVIVIPMRRDGQPEERQRLTGSVLTVGSAGITLQLDNLSGVLAQDLVVGVQAAPGRTLYAGVEVLAVLPQAGGPARVHGLFGGPGDELLQPRNLIPRFHFDSLTFTLGRPPEVLLRWEEIGVLQPVVIDRLLLCPRCRGLPTFLAPINQCLHCAHRFSSQQAYEMVLRGYRAQRLDPEAFSQAS